MSDSATKELLRVLCEDSTSVLAQTRMEPAAYKGLSPFNDTSRNEPFLALAAFAPAAEALHRLPDFDARMGADTTRDFALQFVFNFLGRLTDATFNQARFDEVWNELTTELAEPDWTYYSVCNLNNFTCADESVRLSDGVLVCSRHFSMLARLLGKDETYIDATLGRDWMEGGGGTHVIIVETRLAKHPDNLVLANDAESWTRLSRAFLAMRLSKPGFVRPGRIFFIRKALFRFGLGGISSSGQSRWDIGTSYELTSADVPQIVAAYGALKILDGLGDRTRALSLALRVFSSIYERNSYRADDRLVDSVTAIEAVLRLDTDLSFRSSFQVAGLLAASDEDRVTIFREMKTFYDTRSKVVHGGGLQTKHVAALQKHERLVDLVRRLLSGFVKATAAGKIPRDFYEEIDSSLQHSSRRAALRTVFGWDSAETVAPTAVASPAGTE